MPVRLPQQASRDELTNTVTVVFSCSCPFYVGDNAVLAVCGSTQALGNWKLEDAKYLEREPCSEGLWKTKLKLPHILMEYKYLILSKDDNKLIRWEERWNRNLDLIESKLASKTMEDIFDR
ncbi:hypothetical protein Gasu2_52190 [Galdieria sulphuraria]|nr:hypothetical protein Gasu2_52190 [Galdieria sulphuraria]